MWGRSCVMRTYRTMAGPINLAGLIIQACAFNVIFPPSQDKQGAGTVRRKGGDRHGHFGRIRANKQPSDCEKLLVGKLSPLLRAIFGANLRHRKPKVICLSSLTFWLPKYLLMSDKIHCWEFQKLLRKSDHSIDSSF